MSREYEYIEVVSLEVYTEMSTLLIDLVDTFSQTSIVNRDNIVRGVKSEKKELVWRAAHALKSSSAALGAFKLSKIAAEIESIGKESDWMLLREKVSILISVQESSILELKDYCQRYR